MQVAALSNEIPDNCTGGPKGKNEERFSCYLRDCLSRNGAGKANCIDALSNDLLNVRECTGNKKEMWCDQLEGEVLNLKEQMKPKK